MIVSADESGEEEETEHAIDSSRCDRIGDDDIPSFLLLGLQD